MPRITSYNVCYTKLLRPLGDRLMLTALRESGGGAVAVSDAELEAAADELV